MEIITNGSLLTHEMSDALIDAGLDRIRISIEGITSEKYKEVTGVDIDINDIIEKLEYFCKNKKSTMVYVKTVDTSLTMPGDEEKFHEMFKNACDESNVEQLVPLFNDVDYSEYNMSGKCRKGDSASVNANICPWPFYAVYLDSDGSILPCGTLNAPKLKNITDMSLKEIWDSDFRNNFLLQQIENGKSSITACKDCQTMIYNVSKEDYLDNYKDQLLKIYSGNKRK